MSNNGQVELVKLLSRHVCRQSFRKTTSSSNSSSDSKMDIQDTIFRSLIVAAVCLSLLATATTIEQPDGLPSPVTATATSPTTGSILDSLGEGPAHPDSTQKVTRSVVDSDGAQQQGYSIPFDAFDNLSAKPVTILDDEYDEELYSNSNNDNAGPTGGTNRLTPILRDKYDAIDVINKTPVSILYLRPNNNNNNGPSGSSQLTRGSIFANNSLGNARSFVCKQTRDFLLLTFRVACQQQQQQQQSGLLRLRGFDSKLYYVRTSDGYYVHVVRIVNPNLSLAKGAHKRPVIFNHGLFESATIWLMNARGVRPTSYNQTCGMMPKMAGINATSADVARWRYLNAPMMLSNNGYDVWLMSMRGTEFSLKHNTKSANRTAFWNYSLDDFALNDIPAVVDYVRAKTGSPKVGYVGHSQATLTMFALLSTRPEYATRVEPVIAVAPVTYFKSITSVGRALFNLIRLTTFDDEHGPYPPNAKQMRNFQSVICDTKMISSFACQFIELLIAGQGRRWLRGYYNHMPHYTSLKVLRQFDQLISSGRYAMYDYGAEGNLRHYGSRRNPDYKIERIKSRSIVLIAARLDALSAPSDIEQFKRELRVPLYKSIMVEGRFNHFDLITHPESRRLVNEPILKVMESFEQASPDSVTCSGGRRNKPATAATAAPAAAIGRRRLALIASNTTAGQEREPLHQPETQFEKSHEDILAGARFDPGQLAAALASLSVTSDGARPPLASYDSDDGLGSPDVVEPVPALPPSAVAGSPVAVGGGGGGGV